MHKNVYIVSCIFEFPKINKQHRKEEENEDVSKNNYLASINIPRNSALINIPMNDWLGYVVEMNLDCGYDEMVIGKFVQPFKLQINHF